MSPNILSILAEATPPPVASTVVDINLSVVLSVFAAVFVGINLMNNCVFKPISQKIEKFVTLIETKYTSDVQNSLNDPALKEFKTTKGQLEQNPQKALNTICIYDAGVFLIWFLLIGYFLLYNTMHIGWFVTIFGIFAVSTIGVFFYLRSLMQESNKYTRSIDKTVELGLAKPPTKRKTKGSIRSV